MAEGWKNINGCNFDNDQIMYGKIEVNWQGLEKN